MRRSTKQPMQSSRPKRSCPRVGRRSCSPSSVRRRETDHSDMTPAHASAASVANLDALLDSLSDDDWDRPTSLKYRPSEGPRRTSHRCRGTGDRLAGPSQPGPSSTMWRAPGPSISCAKPPRRRCSPDGGRRRDRWSSSPRTCPLAQPLQLFDIPTTVEGAMVIRTFEAWTHTDDVLRAVGRESVASTRRGPA